MTPTRRRALSTAIVVLIAMAIVGVPVTLSWRRKAYRRAYRRAWRNRAVERIAGLSGDFSWIREQVRAAQSQEPGLYRQEPDLAWLRDEIIVMGDGDWIVYQATGFKQDKRIDDIFVGRASNGRWYYSTYHFCVYLLCLTWGGQPRYLDEFIEQYAMLEFDGRSDIALEETWPDGPEAEAESMPPERQRAGVQQTVTGSPSSFPKTLVLDCSGGVAMEFVLVEPGEFMMGDGDDSHRVRITEPFYVGRHEVTQAQYRRVMGMSPSRFKGAANPVDSVTWDNAMEFCSRLSERTDRTVHLPTEAEWEYACRAGTRTRFCFGDSGDGLGEYAWYSGNSGQRTHPVGGKRANAWGLHDMHGNVWEWCADWYGAYPSGTATDPTGPASGQYRVLRGGCWSYDSQGCRSASRDWPAPAGRLDYFGFRVVVAAQGQ